MGPRRSPDAAADLLRVAVIGPESSGKTTLVHALAGALRDRGVAVTTVAEAGRTLAESLPAGHVWTFREQLATQALHTGNEAAAAVVMSASGGGVLICDGTALTPYVWQVLALRDRPDYDAGPAGVTRVLRTAATAGLYALQVLAMPDIPWVADGVREDPAGRWASFDVHRHLLSGRETLVVGGPTAERAAAVLAVLAPLLPD